MLSILLHPAASGQPTAQPSLGVAIPLVLNNSTVLLANDFLLNKNTLLPAGTQLISCFEPPKPKDADVDMKGKKATLENTFSRKPSKISSLSEEERQQNNAMMRAAAERAFGETWTDATRFQVYFHQLPPERYWVAFLRPNQPKPEIGQIEHWDGMYLGAQDHAVVVLSVEPDSRASRAGKYHLDPETRASGSTFPASSPNMPGFPPSTSCRCPMRSMRGRQRRCCCKA
ncbi:MAG: hypothetical protein HC901_01720 [Bdellovibrionaceae bacterium]|nr:hypothetical protein [Pseudobdellovibrionaceae bacterium]